MSLQQINDLTAITKNSFTEEKQGLTDLTGLVADLWCLLTDELQQILHLSAKCVKADKLELSIGRTDLKDAPIGTLIEKQYDVEQTPTYLRVTPIFVEWDASATSDNSSRKIHAFNFADEYMSADRLGAKFVNDVAAFLTPEERIGLLHAPSLRNDSTPVAKALKLALPMRRADMPSALDDDGPANELF